MPSPGNEGIMGEEAGTIYSKTKKDFGIGLWSWKAKGTHQGLVWGRGVERGKEL